MKNMRAAFDEALALGGDVNFLDRVWSLKAGDSGFDPEYNGMVSVYNLQMSGGPVVLHYDLDVTVAWDPIEGRQE